MANLTKSWKTQTLNVMGPTPTQKWNSFNWGTPSTWGYKAVGQGNTPSLGTFLQHFIIWTKSNSISASCPTGNVFGTANHFRTWTGNNATPVLHADTAKYLTDGRLWAYVFIDHVTNIESAAVAGVFTPGQQGASGWVSASPAVTTWS